MKNHRRTQPLARSAQLRQALGLVLVLGLLVMGIGGCTRAFYRTATDKEVNDILCEKDKYPAWKILQYHVYPDKRARYADPTNPDRPPMPPDDEATWKLSPHPQQPGKAGVGYVQGTGYLEMIKAWDEEARAERDATSPIEKKPDNATEEPKHPIQAYFDEALIDREKGFLLKLDQAVELGVINSREYQNFREELYSAALPVTQQRFNFAYQWAAFADFIRQWAGPKSNVGLQNNWTVNSSIGFSKLFSTGALLTLNFANTTIFNFVGSQGLTSQSTINLNAVQPLLQGGGKAVTLEPLTQAERNLFYAVRAYFRFREQYYVSIALGSNLPNSLATAAGGTGGGGSPISVLAALGIASTDVSGGFVGYLPTLFRECDLAADKKLVHDLGKTLKIYEAYEEGGIYAPLQVDQVRSTYIQAQNTVLTDQQFVMNALDQTKLILGLPANLPLILDDTPARPITRQYDRYYEVIADSDAAIDLVQKQEQYAPDKLRPFLYQMFTEDALVRGTKVQKELPAAWIKWVAPKEAEILPQMKELIKERDQLLDLKAKMERLGESLTAEQTRRKNELDFQFDLIQLGKDLRNYEDRQWGPIGKGQPVQPERVRLFRLISGDAKKILVWARNERFDEAYNKWEPMPATYLDHEIDLLTANVDQAQEAAVRAALTQRVDLMNARAQLVDAWRQLRVTANGLLGVFNIRYNLQSQTPPGGSHPLAFSTAASDSQLALDFSFPLNRVSQRNAYRTALINYQRQRRALMALEDNIAVQVRFDVRQLQLFAANYTNQKQVLQSLYKQVESARELVFGPPDPDQVKGGSASAVAGAALTNQYLGALSSLNGAQTRMYQIWLSLLATRIQLYLDLERLTLDNRNVWVEDCGASPRGASETEARSQPSTTPALPSPRAGTADGETPLLLPVQFGVPVAQPMP